MRIDGPPNQRDVHSTHGGPGIHVRRVRDSDETYDCVIVGAGASGLAAAKYYRDRFGENSRILLLDPLPDFGGHSHRNEFHVGPTTFLKNGGTVNLDSTGRWNETTGGLMDIPGSYGQPALDMLDYLGVVPDEFPEISSANLGLRTMLLFPAKDWGKDSVVPNKTNALSWTQWLATTPWSSEAQAAIVRIQEGTTDWIEAKHGDMSREAKKALLSRLTQKRYYMDYIGAPEKAILQYQRNGHGLLGAGAQAVSAGDMWALSAPGFQGLDLGNEPFPGIGRTPQFVLLEDEEESASPTWPDGNSSLLRLLVDRLIPGAVSHPGGSAPTMENVVNAVTDYSKLDRSGNKVRIRLHSLVFRVEPASKRKKLAEVDYLIDGEKSGRRVRAKHVVMACWNRVTAHVLEDLPRQQVKDLCYARKVAADLRPGRPEQLAGVQGREHRQHLAARQQPVLGQHERAGGAQVRLGLRADARHTRPAGGAQLHRRPDRPQRDAAARRLRGRPQEAAADERPRPREGARRRDRPHRQQVRRRLRAAAGHPLDHVQPLELRLRARDDLGVGPVAVRAVGEPAAGPRPQAAEERVDRQQRLGRVRLHAQRDQRGLPGGAGPARLATQAGRSPASRTFQGMKVGLIGAGNMAAALARGWGDPVLATDSGSGKAAALAQELGGEAVASNYELAVNCDVVVLAHKPAQLEAVAREAGPAARAVVSLLGRTTIAELRAAYPDTPVVRVQPNTPAEVGRGVTLLAEPAEEPLAGQVEELFGRVGVVVRVPEGIIDASAACSGVGPAYWALVAEAWVEAAIRRGIPGPIAQQLVTETMAGSAELLRARGHDTLRLRREVTSPGGTTARGLAALERGGLRAAFAAAMDDVLGPA